MRKAVGFKNSCVFGEKTKKKLKISEIRVFCELLRFLNFKKLLSRKFGNSNQSLYNPQRKYHGKMNHLSVKFETSQ
jgi:hypothetical protein